MKNMFRRSLAIALVCCLSGCALTSPMLEPDVPVPAAWNEAAGTDTAAVSSTWWNSFGSAELQSLVDEALAGSPDLAIATERVNQAEAQVRVAGASLFPVLTPDGGTSTRRTSTVGGGKTGGPAVVDSVGNIGLTVSYELDLWGKNHDAVRSAESSASAASFDRDTAQLTLVSGVATSYFEVLALRARLAIGRDNLAIAQRVFDLVSARARDGAASALDVSRQQATVLSQQAALVPLEQQEHQTLAALAVLVGRPPEGFDVQATGIADITVPAIDPGLPSNLLVRRPDLASAEAQLAAANADVAAARAALLPTITLTGSAGLATTALTSLATGGTTAAIGIAASLLQPIFDGGHLRGEKAIAESRERELVETYRKAILASFDDVEQALAGTSRLGQQEQLQEGVQTSARESLRLAEVRYKAGADDLLTVLDAQRTLFAAQDQLAQVQLNRLQAAVSLYKALGGGWGGEDTTAPVPAA
ncbi:MAG TPA: efflux transporter outer membrane subunit [Candidatus Methylomirabilis sp.]|nr:efflux transporter outer membrane subunit [Candidatus Methylomirabilis sp.]